MANIIDRMAVFVAFYGIELPLITSKVLTACRPHDRPSLPLCMINGRIVRFLRASTHRLFHWMIILARDRLGSAEELAGRLSKGAPNSILRAKSLNAGPKAPAPPEIRSDAKTRLTLRWKRCNASGGPPN